MTIANPTQTRNKRILIIDDTASIHDDFRLTLTPDRSSGKQLANEAAALFGEPVEADVLDDIHDFVVDSAFQGQDGYEKVRAAIAEDDPYAVAFVDMRMPPGWDGLETIERLWEIDGELQVVICSAYSDYSWEDILRRLGVNDRLLLLKKPFDIAEVSQLAVALTQKWLLAQQAGMKFNELQSLVDQKTEDLRRAAFRDKLTGLPNRAALFERLKACMGSAHTDGFGLLFLDFDRFKLINDSLGHDKGDELLIQITSRIRSIFQITEDPSEVGLPFAARLGGDEFVFVWSDTGDNTVLQDRTEKLLEALRPGYDLHGHEVTSTASIGLTTSRFNYTCPEDAIRDADVAMYHAKRTGKDRACLFTSEMHQEAVDRLNLEGNLRQAFANDHLRLHYQPIVGLQSGEVAGFEALLRWPDAERGFISPDEFIPVAEETGQIVEIGRWVLKTAIQQLADWRARFDREGLFMSVNLSKRQLLDTSFVGTLRDLITEAAVPAKAIRMEITETTIMGNPETVIPVLVQLRQLGVEVSMDDFGKGHSSLGCLHRFPLTTLKIDQMFVENIKTHSEYAAIVQAIVVLAKNLGVEVVAKGIETESQFVQLQALDCDYAQGHYIGSPGAPEDVSLQVRPLVGSV